MKRLIFDEPYRSFIESESNQTFGEKSSNDRSLKMNPFHQTTQQFQEN
jgi:hypothetical protein